VHLQGLVIFAQFQIGIAHIAINIADYSGLLLTTFARLFIHEHNETLALVQTFGIFAIVLHSNKQSNSKFTIQIQNRFLSLLTYSYR
jgi:hypothetical protein